MCCMFRGPNLFFLAFLFSFARHNRRNKKNKKNTIMMNLFRLSADMMHLASILILLAKIKQSRSCVG